MPAAAAKKPPRNRDLGRIHALKRDLGLSDDQYRVMLWTVARVESSADLDSHGRQQVIAHLEAHARRANAGTSRGFPGRPHNADTRNRAELLKIEALLTDAGRPWAYAERVLQQQTAGGCHKLAFASPSQLSAVIAALYREALKRLGRQAAEIFGDGWERHVQVYAVHLFRFAPRASASRNPQAISQVLRWWRGELPAVSPWPREAPAPEAGA